MNEKMRHVKEDTRNESKTIQELIENVKNTKYKWNCSIELQLDQYYAWQCEFCGKLLTRNYPKIEHENTFQKPSIHIFCSKACRNKWVFLLQKIHQSESIPNYIHKVEINEK